MLELSDLENLIGELYFWVDFVDSKVEIPFLSFVEDEKWLSKINTDKTSLKVLLYPVSLDLPDSIKTNILCVPCENPRVEFFQLIKSVSDKIFQLHFSSKQLLKGDNCSIAETSILDGRIQLGDNVTIGDYTIIKGDVKIGDNTIISDHSVIGLDGFQISSNKNGVFDCNIPHFGSVVIGKNCKIGSFSNIARSIFSAPTKLGDNVFLDNFVQVAHNVQIGDNCVITPMTILSGGVILEDNIRIAPGVSVNNKVKIKAKTFVGIGSVMLASNKKSGTLFGNPVRLIKE